MSRLESDSLGRGTRFGRCAEVGALGLARTDRDSKFTATISLSWDQETAIVGVATFEGFRRRRSQTIRSCLCSTWNNFHELIL